VAARRSVGSVRNWWRAVAATGAALALAKLVSVHSAAKAASPVLTLIVGVLLAAALLGVLAVTGRRWGVDAARPVVVALAGYAGAALGLDAVTWAVVSLDHHSATSAGATFVEELGEGLTSLLVVVALRWHLPVGQTGAASDAGGYGGQAVRQQ